jgi:hypothetical protein
MALFALRRVSYKLPKGEGGGEVRMRATASAVCKVQRVPSRSPWIDNMQNTCSTNVRYIER